jgi:muramidase (phage lysozyme)
MASFIDTPQTTDPLEILQYFQRRREQSPEDGRAKGIASKPGSGSIGDTNPVLGFLGDWMLSSQEKAAQARQEVMESTAAPRIRTAEQIEAEAMLSAKEAAAARDKAGIKRSLPESRTDTAGKLYDEDFMSTILDTATDGVSAGKDTEESAPVTAEQGLMSPRPVKRPDDLMPSSSDQTLLSFIAKGEGSYDSSNRGTKKGKIVGSTHATSRTGKKLSDMTIGEIQKLQAIKSPDNKDRLFAVGKYQLIPTTLAMAVDSLGIAEDQVFNEETQEKLGMWLMMEKRQDLGDYIRGKHDDLDKALEAAAKEWASLPDPKTGKSYYGSGNKAQHSVEETKRAIRGARAEYSRSKE